MYRAYAYNGFYELMDLGEFYEWNEAVDALEDACEDYLSGFDSDEGDRDLFWFNSRIDEVA